MYVKNKSGQFVYLGLVSAFSGNAVTGASGQISGRRSIDGGSQGLFSGFITEIGGGQYILNGFDFDFNGNNIGMLFTASGCVPVNYTVLTIGGISGQVFICSGQSVNVFSGQLSGYTMNPNSGATWLTSGHQAALYSGQNVNMFSGQLSGQQVNLLSGNQTAVVSGTNVNTWSGQTQIASGPFVVTSIVSGTTFLASGQSVNLLSGNNVQLYSGQNVNIYSGQLSGYTINPNSGAFVNAAASVASGTTFLASGQIATEIPKAVHVWNYSGAPNVSGQPCLLNAERKLINRFDLSTFSGQLAVYQEDNATLAYLQAVSTVSGGQPIGGLSRD